MKPAGPESAASKVPPEHVTLRDGRSVTIRAVRADDAGAMLAAFDSLSPEARYSRFMSPLLELPAALAERSAHPLPGLERAFVAITGEGNVAGGARYVKAEDGETCEFAVTLTSAWSGAGLASRIMEVLIRDACSCGLRRMEGYVLAENRSMLDLARRLGFEIGVSEEGPSVKLVRLDLAGRRQDSGKE
jgi:RimJ/RimL family protein N-acetyltransferase